MNNPKQLIIFTIILWSFGSILTRLISISSPLLSTSLLFFFTSISLLLFAVFEYKNDFLTELKNIKLSYIFFGLLGYFVYYIGLTESFHIFNSASTTTVLNYTFPIFTVLFTELTRKKLNNTSSRYIEYAGIGLGFLSIVFLATQGNPFSLKIANIPGFLWGLSAGVAYGLFSVYSSTVSEKQQAMFLFISVFTSWILSFIIAIPYLKELQTLPLYVYFVSIIAAFLVNGLGYMTWTRANVIAKEKHISISSAISFIFTLPVISLILVGIFFKETTLFHSYFLFSLLLLLAGTILCQKSEVFMKFLENERY